jgi:xanthine/uracil/vitamin C permease (AzgA family)
MEKSKKVSGFGKALGLKPDTSVKTEIIAGLTTFFAMCYIIVVNPNQITGFYNYLGGEVSKLWSAVYVGTIAAAVIGTLLYAFLAKKPFAQASGMGLNSFFFTSFILPCAITVGDDIVGFNGLTTNFGAGLVIILISGLIFLILSVTGLRSYIAKSLPDCLSLNILLSTNSEQYSFTAFICLSRFCSFVLTLKYAYSITIPQLHKHFQSYLLLLSALLRFHILMLSISRLTS